MCWHCFHKKQWEGCLRSGHPYRQFFDLRHLKVKFFLSLQDCTTTTVYLFRFIHLIAYTGEIDWVLKLFCIDPLSNKTSVCMGYILYRLSKLSKIRVRGVGYIMKKMDKNATQYNRSRALFKIRALSNCFVVCYKVFNSFIDTRRFSLSRPTPCSLSCSM